MSKKENFFTKLPPETQRKVIRITEIVLGVIAVVAVIYALTALLSHSAKVTARIDCAWLNGGETPTELALYNGDVTSVLNDNDPANDPAPRIVFRIEPNQDKVINDIISEGDYTLSVYTIPVLEDGTTFSQPAAQLVRFDGVDDITVVFNLETA